MKGFEAETFEAKGYKGISASKIQVLEKYIENGGKALDYHELPYHIQRQLEMGRVHELLYQDVNRWLQDNAPNPHHAMPSWLSAEGEDIFSDKDEAMKRAKELGTTEIHSHKINGDTIYMPFKTHEEYKKMMKSKGHMSFGSETFEAEDDLNYYNKYQNYEKNGTPIEKDGYELSWGLASLNRKELIEEILGSFEYDYLLENNMVRKIADREEQDAVMKLNYDNLFGAETFEARENKDGTIVLSDAEFRGTKLLHNGNYLWYDDELKFIKHLVNSVKLEKVRRYNDVEMPLVLKYEKALKDQEYKVRMRFREQLYDYGIRRGRNRVNDKTVYHRSEGFEVETFEEKIDIDDFNKVADAIQAVGQPATVLFQTKFGTPEIVVVMGDDIYDDENVEIVIDILDDLKIPFNSSSVVGDTNTLDRKEYDILRKINGGHKDFLAETFDASGIDTLTEPFTEMKTGSILKKVILLGSLGVGALVGNKLRK
jgi:hypothetical protein